MLDKSKLSKRYVFFLIIIISFWGCKEPEKTEDVPEIVDSDWNEVINIPLHIKSTAQNQTQKNSTEIETNLLPVGGEYKTSFFYMKTDFSYDYARTWGDYISQTFQHLAKIIPPQLQTPSNIFIFKNKQRFRDLTQIIAPENLNSLGFYDPSMNSIVTYDSNNPERLTRTLLHELTHLILRQHIGHNCIPPWLDEGLACVFETGQFVNGTWVFGLPRLGFVRYIKQVQRVREIKPFQEIMTLGWRNFIAVDNIKLEFYYMLSWSIVYFFLFYDEGQYKNIIERMLREIRKTQEPEMKYETLYEVFIKPDEENLTNSWNQFLNSFN